MAEPSNRNRFHTHHHHTFQRSLSPSGRFCSSSISSSTPTFADRHSQPASLFHRPTSPNRVNLAGFASSPSSSSSVRFSVNNHHPNSSVRSQNGRALASHQKKTCSCSPTTHPGSFRCSLHKNEAKRRQTTSYQPNGLNMRRSAMVNSLVRIGTVEGDLVRRALATLIRPSSHQQRRRDNFQPRPSRLSIMSNAGDP